MESSATKHKETTRYTWHLILAATCFSMGAIFWGYVPFYILCYVEIKTD